MDKASAPVTLLPFTVPIIASGCFDARPQENCHANIRDEAVVRQHTYSVLP